MPWIVLSPYRLFKSLSFVASPENSLPILNGPPAGAAGAGISPNYEGHRPGCVHWYTDEYTGQHDCGMVYVAGRGPLMAAARRYRPALLCEYLASPAVGVDHKAPRFSWALAAAGRGAASAAYQIVVADDANATVWDTGRVASGASGQ
eukprot:gene6068-6905_t